MPKSLSINPEKARKSGSIRFRPIPVNRYDTPFEEEVTAYGREALVRIYRDMVIIREFETMLNQIKTAGQYHGQEYYHAGPAHLSIGQEASAVGQAYVLEPGDYVFGSHRSHGEILAKGLSAIEKLPDDRLMEIMSTYFGGKILSIVEAGKDESVKQLAVRFLLYGTLAEIFARETGFNKGLGGSMHAFFTPFGIYPNNAIVGGSADISVGAALYKKCNREPGLVVCNIGDGSLGCGPVWEALCLATMDQFKKLWEGDYRGGLPLIFNFMNNHYGMGGQTMGETMGFDILARIGAGVNPEQMHAERIDGYNPLAVIDAFRRKKQIIEAREGPCLLDTVTYRISGHSPSDASSYREKDEIAAWEQQDSIADFGEKLAARNVCDSQELEAVRESVVELIRNSMARATDDSVSPRMNPSADPGAIGGVMFSNQRIEKLDDRACEVNMPLEENPRVKQIARRSRKGVDAEGKVLPKGKAVQYRDAIFEAVAHGFYTDPTLVAYGEENRDWGGAFAVYRGLTEALPYNRLFNSPISEGAICGSATGYGMCGGRVIVELMYCDFLGRAGDEVFNQMAKWQAMSAGELRMPVVLRVSVGSKYGAQHSQDWTSLCTHIPGLKVVFPATPYDAKGLMNAALVATDPVVFFESQRIYDIGELFREEGVPEGFYEIPIGEPDVKREGKDLTIITAGATLYTAAKAADILRDKYGLEAELIDLRSLTPLNYEPILESVRKTHRVLLASDACQRGSYLNDVAQSISEMAFDDLDAPPVVVGSRNWITPAHELEKSFFPQPEWIVDAVHERILPLDGHQTSQNVTIEEKLRLSRQGI
ncbi:MAG: dehydrogenase [Chitinivibrionales bacterium]|nr:dehydrogenase [Chitinivibrionales bacterium]MBD3396166.1 dehydrogenase [Chitinivibrionales bacterium]